MILRFKKSGAMRLFALVVTFNMSVTTAVWSAPALAPVIPRARADAGMLTAHATDSIYRNILAAFPDDLGSVVKVSAPGREAPFIIHIRDVHANPGAETIPEDASHTAQKEVQKLTDKHTGQVDEALKHKETEIHSI